MQVKSIHQFSPSCGKGDGVSNGMFFTRTLLRELGFESEIFSDLIPPELVDEVRAVVELKDTDDVLLMVHHSLGYENSAWLLQLSMPKLLVYHNITPPQFLPNNGLPELSLLGRQQLRDWVSHFIGAIGDSDLNSSELHEAGYVNVVSIPLLVDVQSLRKLAKTAHDLPQLRGAYNLLFVGRFCEHKNQLLLINMLQELRHLSPHPVRLILVGGVTSDPYHELVRNTIREQQLEQMVMLTGKISDTQLVSFYRHADVFISLSEHEGFGMPLIEAMLNDLPVVARASAAISDTMGAGGIVLEATATPRQAAENIHTLLTQPALRRSVIDRQRHNVQRFEREHLRTQLSLYLNKLGIAAKVFQVPIATSSEDEFWQIEGPFDSSYSLAIVNRTLAKALQQQGKAINLRSREGSGDFAPSQAFFQADADASAMWQRGLHSVGNPLVALRNCYPPYLDHMPAKLRVLQSYGWEETGFPNEYVNEINRRADLVTVVSRFVGKVLRDNGVRTPIAVVGNGVDHLPTVNAVDAANILPHARRAFCFLHVSSCFPRKGVDALLRAYGVAFRDSDDISLIIKTFPNPHNDVQQQLHHLRELDPLYPHVVVIEDDYSQEQMTSLYRSCDVLVAPSRGEGFGLPIAEAMMLDVPVITTGWSGQTDFCDTQTTWLCDYQFTQSTSHFSYTHSVWAEPDVDHLASLLRDLKTSTQEEKKTRTKAAKQRLLAHHTWADVAQRTSDALIALESQPLMRQEPQIGWISSWNARCGIASYSAFLMSAIPSERISILTNFTAERTHMDGHNVVRCWDASMEESLDVTYEVIKERDLGAIVIQYNFGFFPLSALANLIQRLRHDGIAVHVFFHSTADLIRSNETISLRNISSSLAMADRLYVHGVEDLNRLKTFGLVDNVVFFPQGIMPPAQEMPLTPAEEKRLAGKTLIAAYGFLLPHKGMQALIRAFYALRLLALNNAKNTVDNPLADGSNLHLLMITSLYPVGISDHELWACQALVQELGLAEHVSINSRYLSDQQSQARLQRATLIVYPYQQTQESSSAAVRMGLAAGRPVAVTPIPIFDDVAEAVYRLPGNEPEQMAQGIYQLLSDPVGLEQKTAQSQIWLKSRQWPVLSARLLNIIDGIANNL